jgi:hypothetical protein
MGDFEISLADEITRPGVRSGEELVLPFDEARRAVGIATDRLIAVLGVEVFRILADGLGVVTYSGYGFEPSEWAEFVRANNDEAGRFLISNRLGDGYGYILTATSEQEFRRLGKSP